MLWWMGIVSELAGSIAPETDGEHLDEIVRARATRPLYQPIVDLDPGRVVAWEALARGPEGSPLESPAELFGAAARHGRTAELDHCCQAAAIEGAIDAGLARSQ